MTFRRRAPATSPCKPTPGALDCLSSTHVSSHVPQPISLASFFAPQVVRERACAASSRRRAADPVMEVLAAGTKPNLEPSFAFPPMATPRSPGSSRKSAHSPHSRWRWRGGSGREGACGGATRRLARAVELANSIQDTRVRSRAIPRIHFHLAMDDWSLFGGSGSVSGTLRAGNCRLVWMETVHGMISQLISRA